MCQICFSFFDICISSCAFWSDLPGCHYNSYVHYMRWTFNEKCLKQSDNHVNLSESWLYDLENEIIVKKAAYELSGKTYKQWHVYSRDLSNIYTTTWVFSVNKFHERGSIPFSALHNKNMYITWWLNAKLIISYKWNQFCVQPSMFLLYGFCYGLVKLKKR